MFRRKKGENPDEFRRSDVLAMIIAALQVVLPFVLLLIVVAGIVYGLFLLLF